jgi:hypothetical protein
LCQFRWLQRHKHHQWQLRGKNRSFWCCDVSCTQRNSAELKELRPCRYLPSILTQQSNTPPRQDCVLRKMTEHKLPKFNGCEHWEIYRPGHWSLGALIILGSLVLAGNKKTKQTNNNM